jgi:hypothetical protein
MTPMRIEPGAAARREARMWLKEACRRDGALRLDVSSGLQSFSPAAPPLGFVIQRPTASAIAAHLARAWLSSPCCSRAARPHPSCCRAHCCLYYPPPRLPTQSLLIALYPTIRSSPSCSPCLACMIPSTRPPNSRELRTSPAHAATAAPARARTHEHTSDLNMCQAY